MRLLLEQASTNWPFALPEPVARITWEVDMRGTSVMATCTLRDWDGFVIAIRQYDGHWQGEVVHWVARPGL